MNPRLSIIIPIYNSENYLDDCISSILNQTYKDYELILVDDGSKDSSGHLCDKYAKANPERIRVVHKTNGGASTARNVGLDVAQGHYIGFVDSDDIISPRMFEILMETISESDCDIVSSPLICSTKKPIPEFIEKKEILFEGKGYDLLENIFKWQENCSVYTKVFKKEIIGETRFKEGLTNEDFRFLCDIFIKESKVVTLKHGLYWYRDTPGSVTRVMRPNFFDLFTNLDYVETILPPTDENLKKLFNQYSLTIHIVSGVRIVKGRYHKTYKDWLRTNRRFISKNWKLLLKPGGLSLRWRLKAMFTFLRLPELSTK